MQLKHHWPSLDYNEWKSTYETLHRWVQIVGKLRLCKTPYTNHSWHSTFYVTSRGLSTMAIPDGERNFTVDFDFINHKCRFVTSDIGMASFDLKNESVSDFYEHFNDCLKKLNIVARFDPHPNEIADYIPFSEDRIHCTYKPEEAHRCWQVLVRANNVMNLFRSNYIGKSSPVHFFWGAFDLAVTRFSGRNAPEHPAGIPHISDLVIKEAYSQEVSSCGFWPGNEMYPHSVFYSYAYPEPKGFSKAVISPQSAFYLESLKEFILPYEEVIKSSNPENLVLDFFESTYKAAADLGGWNRVLLEESPFLRELKKANQQATLHEF